MRNLTLAVTEDMYRSARVWATLCNTSVSALVRSFFEALHNLPCPGADVPEGAADAPGAIQAAEKLIRSCKKCQGTTLVVPKVQQNRRGL